MRDTARCGNDLHKNAPETVEQSRKKLQHQLRTACFIYPRGDLHFNRLLIKTRTDDDREKLTTQ